MSIWDKRKKRKMEENSLALGFVLCSISYCRHSLLRENAELMKPHRQFRLYTSMYKEYVSKYYMYKCKTRQFKLCFRIPKQSELNEIFFQP